MRKHFLILMLMALLPLAGWAQTSIANYKVTLVGTGALTYNATDQKGDIELRVKKSDAETPLDVDVDYTVKFYASDATTEVTEVQNAGTYYASAVGIGAYEGETAKLSFVISKATVKYTLKEGTGASEINFTATYKKENFGEKSFVIENVKLVDDAVGGESVAELFDVAATAKWSYTGTNANFDKDGVNPLTTGDKGYQVSLTGITPKAGVNVNYDFAYDPNYVKIKQAVIDVTTEDFIPDDGEEAAVPSYTYDARKLTPTYTIKYQYGTGTNFEILTAGTHFDVTYNKAAAENVDPIAADETNNYVAYAKAKDNTNFVVANTNAKKLLGQFKIMKKNLTVSVRPDSKIYDNEELHNEDLNQANIRYSGVAENDLTAAANNFPDGDGHAEVTLTFAAGTGTVKNAAEYTVVVNNVAATTAIKNYNVKWMTDPTYYTQAEINAAAEAAGDANYNDMSPEEKATWDAAHPAHNKTIADVKIPGAPAIRGKYTIERRNVKVTLSNISFERGDAKLVAAKTAKQTIDVDPKANDEDTEYNVEIEKATATSETGVVGDQNLAGALKIYLAKGTYDDAKEYTGKISLEFTFGDEIGANYKVNTKYSASGAATTVEVATSNLNVSAEQLNVYVDVLIKKYGYALDTDDFVCYALNKDGEEVALTGTAVYAVYDGEDAVAEGTVLSIGNYTVKLDPSSTLSAANYDVSSTNFHANALIIQKKPVTVTINPLTLNKGTKTSVMRSYASVKSYKDDMVGDEDIAFEYYYNTEVGGVGEKVATTGVDDPALNSDPATYAKGIHARLLTSASQKKNNDNYEVTFTYGSLTIVAATDLVLNDKDENLASKIEAAAAACAADAEKKYSVKFSTRELTGGLWNVLVLPFDIKVADLSQEFGYAVVDILDITSTSDAHFKLHLGTIPANVPFMVKVAETINLAGDATAVPAIAAKKFDNMIIKYAANADANLTILENGNSCVADAAGNKFIGTYVKTATNSATDRILGKRPQDADNGWWPYTGNVEPLRAILQLGSAAARILIDEEDGSTTEISTITAEGKAMPVEGWYTLNGVKLQGIPTEKGIYINNGKKVVIK